MKRIGVYQCLLILYKYEFKKNKYQVLRGAISKELADFGYRYLQVSAEADNWMLKNYVTHAGNHLVGKFHDKQLHHTRR